MGFYGFKKTGAGIGTVFFLYFRFLDKLSHENISETILSLPLIQEEQMSVNSETAYGRLAQEQYV